MTKQEIIHASLLDTLHSEGGLAKESADVGGWSYAGITQRSYEKEYLANKRADVINPPEHVRELGGTSIDKPEFKYKSPLDIPDEEGVRKDIVMDYYEGLYIPKSGSDLLPVWLIKIHLDFFVNARGTAIKIIQDMCGVEADGILGSGTRAALAKWTAEQEALAEQDPYLDNKLINQYDEAKRKHYNYLATKNPDKYGDYLEGWLRRCDKVKAELQHYFDDEEPTPSAVEEEHDILLVEENANTRVDDLESEVAEMKSMLQQLIERLPKKESK